jgi:hypothetical protein
MTGPPPVLVRNQLPPAVGTGAAGLNQVIFSGQNTQFTTAKTLSIIVFGLALFYVLFKGK